MTKFFNRFKKLSKTVFDPFLVHFPNFFGKIFFLENPVLLRTTSYGFLVPCLNLEKTNDTIPRKRLERRKDGRKNGRMVRPYFIGPFWLLSGVQKKFAFPNNAKINHVNYVS